ncbi:hypothetical protein [Nocardia alni]|uniref:hypothetical protein n=1 Tax=Nocardia alni TaxID=2815723 RepID=UPI001C242D87|nr:hypothetical protein [Nocardia alni]
MAVDGHPVIMVTFAGRQDRMELLTHYIGEALRLGVIDEWHVWNFSRNDNDDRWLKSRFPIVGRTPDDLVYYPAGDLGKYTARKRTWLARVRARSDVHIGIEARYEGAPSYELVIGGWGNQRTVLRRVDTSELLTTEHHLRANSEEPVAVAETPGILSAALFRHIEVSADDRGIRLSVDGGTALEYELNSTPGLYKIYVKTGYGADGEWRFPDRPDTGEYLYQCAERIPDNWSELYKFYADQAAHYAETVFLKCDDDIVYIQLDELANFIRFRLRERKYFLVSGNVVNNGVCAYHQQRLGVLPEELMKIELSGHGIQTLWRSAAMATDLHNYFLNNRELFEQMLADPIPWRGRISINFVSWIGRDMSYMSGEMTGDEFQLSAQIPDYLDRANCFYPRLLVSHLTFFPQDLEFDHETILDRYRRLAMATGLALEGATDPRGARDRSEPGTATL